MNGCAAVATPAVSLPAFTRFSNGFERRASMVQQSWEGPPPSADSTTPPPPVSSATRASASFTRAHRRIPKQVRHHHHCHRHHHRWGLLLYLATVASSDLRTRDYSPGPFNGDCAIDSKGKTAVVTDVTATAYTVVIAKLTRRPSTQELLRTSSHRRCRRGHPLPGRSPPPSTPLLTTDVVLAHEPPPPPPPLSPLPPSPPLASPAPPPPPSTSSTTQRPRQSLPSPSPPPAAVDGWDQG